MNKYLLQIFELFAFWLCLLTVFLMIWNDTREEYGF